MLDHAIRLIVITDRLLAAPRDVIGVAELALKAGAPAVQLRDKNATARDLLTAARTLRPLTRRHGALLFVNDRFDVALSADADGVHLGPHDLSVTDVRRAAPGLLIGYSTDDPTEAERAAAAGADYIGCGAVFPTVTKRDAGESIGVEGLDRVARTVSIPVVGIGGIGPTTAAEVATTRAAGVAVSGAVMAASDPSAAVRACLAPFAERSARKPGRH